MNTKDLENGLVKILRKRDKAWFVAAATSLGKHPDEVTYSDLAPVSFGEFTSARAGVDVEFHFGVCLPLSVHQKNWTTEQYFNYLRDRSKKTSINLKLARSRTDSPGIKTTFKIALTSGILLLSLIFIYVLWQFTGLLTLVLAIFGFPIPMLMSFDYLWTHLHYTRLARRIDTMRD